MAKARAAHKTELEKLLTDVATGFGGQLDHIVFPKVHSEYGRVLASGSSNSGVDRSRWTLSCRHTIISPRKTSPTVSQKTHLTSGRVAEKPVKGVAVLAVYSGFLYICTVSHAPLRWIWRRFG